MPAEENKRAFRRIPEEIVNTGDFALMDELFDADYVEHATVPPGMPTGRAGVEAYFTMLRTAFPDLHFTVDLIVGEGDLTAGHITARGTHKGEFRGVASTGKEVTWSETHIGRYARGKLAEHWGDADVSSLLRQLGVAPVEIPAAD